MPFRGREAGMSMFRMKTPWVFAALCWVLGCSSEGQKVCYQAADGSGLICTRSDSLADPSKQNDDDPGEDEDDQGKFVCADGDDDDDDQGEDHDGDDASKKSCAKDGGSAVVDSDDDDDQGEDDDDQGFCASVPGDSDGDGVP